MPPHTHQLPVATIWLIGVLATALLLFFARNYLLDLEEEHFYQESATLMQRLSGNLFSVERGVLGLSSFLQIAPKIYPDDFRLLSQPHLDAPFISSAAYLPAVPADEREAFEQLQEEWHSYIGFRIRDYQQGQPLTEGEQDHHFPVLVFEPRTVKSLGILGRDLSTCKDIETVLQEAIDTAATTIAFGGKESCIKNLVALKPVYHGRQPPNQVSERQQRIKGFVKLDIDSRRLLQLESGKHLQVKLEADFAEIPLAEWNSDDMPSPFAVFKVFSNVQPLSGVFNDKLRLRITKTIEWSGMQYMLLFLSAATGLMLTLFIHRFFIAHHERLRISEFHRQEIQQEVDHKTRELERANKKLEILYRNAIEQQETLEHTMRRAEEANSAKSEFLANMSHELRTPMHAILSFSAFGQKKWETATRKKLSGYFSHIHASGERLLILLNDLLDLSKLEAGRMILECQKCDLRIEANKCVHELEGYMTDRGVQCELLPSKMDTQGEFDAMRISQVITNLLSNAIKFTPAGGVVQISVSQDRLEIDGHETAALLLSVLDQGIGIPKEELNTIFEKFIQSSKTRTGAGGTGLGLAISKEIIEAHAGRIWVENNLEQGAQFHFLIPVTPLIQSAAENRAQ
ncbi:MAG: CHASE domain-containing protein [gamma proteobacterium endosymbiont of Lamellibrachia anaximandri]|nr:CHASE domain-containing protein [gamma proteobacterium endosymbiont of Lamellibrachia anaximandri]MBL3535563.1 CHASE domain-containing protein [gamma proteobacterium endosymbiont of Lamellibrachia anaximandri]